MSETDAQTQPAATEEKPAEETENVTEEKDDSKPAQRKNTRQEKKMKESLLKHNLKQLEGVSTVMMRKGQQIMWSFTNPEVYYLDNVYVVFGDPQMQDAGRQAIDQLRQSANSVDDTPTEPQARVMEDPNVEVDTTGLKEEDINTIMDQVKGISRARAAEALRKANCDLVTAVMDLTC